MKSHRITTFSNLWGLILHQRKTHFDIVYGFIELQCLMSHGWLVGAKQWEMGKLNSFAVSPLVAFYVNDSKWHFKLI